MVLTLPREPQLPQETMGSTELEVCEFRPHPLEQETSRSHLESKMVPSPDGSKSKLF